MKCGNISTISSYCLYQYDSTFWGYTGVFFGFNISVIGSAPKRRGEISLQQMPKKDKKVLSALFNFQPSSLAFAFTSSTSSSTAPNAKVSAVVVDGYSIVTTSMFCSLRCPMVIFPSFPSFMVYAFALPSQCWASRSEKGKCDFVKLHYLPLWLNCEEKK